MLRIPTKSANDWLKWSVCFVTGSRNPTSSDTKAVINAIRQYSAERRNQLILVIDRLVSEAHWDRLVRILDDSALREIPLALILLARTEDLASWPNVQNRIQSAGFRPYYIRRWWGSELDLPAELRRVVQIQESGQSTEQDQLLAWVDHLKYCSRGSIAMALRELKSSYDWKQTDNKVTFDPSVPFERDREAIEHNAFVQRLLERRFRDIAESLFNSRQAIDQAWLGVYETIDWMKNEVIFSRNDLDKIPNQSTITVSHRADVRHQAHDNLLRVLQEEGYLEPTSEGQMRLCWRRALDDKLLVKKQNRRIRLGLRGHPIDALTKQLTVQIALECIEKRWSLHIPESDKLGTLIRESFTGYWELFFEDFDQTETAIRENSSCDSVLHLDFSGEETPSRGSNAAANVLRLGSDPDNKNWWTIGRTQSSGEWLELTRVPRSHQIIPEVARDIVRLIEKA